MVSSGPCPTDRTAFTKHDSSRPARSRNVSCLFLLLALRRSDAFHKAKNPKRAARAPHNTEHSGNATRGLKVNLHHRLILDFRNARLMRVSVAKSDDTQEKAAKVELRKWKKDSITATSMDVTAVGGLRDIYSTALLVATTTSTTPTPPCLRRNA
ncbi:hypothetical protein PM082_024290 [Marasmius tenuissimus]|nr:hypothetical protein PM082_024290 [Marasmius tenuissimus]